MKNTVTATRGGEKREFPALVWKNMPKEKYGWKIVSDVPDELKQDIAAAKEAGTEEGADANTNPNKYEGMTIDALRAEITARSLTYPPAAKEAGLTKILVQSDIDGYVSNQA